MGIVLLDCFQDAEQRARTAAATRDHLIDEEELRIVDHIIY